MSRRGLGGHFSRGNSTRGDSVMQGTQELGRGSPASRDPECAMQRTGSCMAVLTSRG